MVNLDSVRRNEPISSITSSLCGGLMAGFRKKIAPMESGTKAQRGVIRAISFATGEWLYILLAAFATLGVGQAQRQERPANE